MEGKMKYGSGRTCKSVEKGVGVLAGWRRADYVNGRFYINHLVN